MTYAVPRVIKSAEKQRDDEGVVRVFGDQLAEGRERSGLSLGQVAIKATGLHAPISRSEIFQIEKGNRPGVGAHLLYVLARLYRQDFLWLTKVLEWNRAHTTARSLPESLPAAEGIMIVTGLEQDFIRRFRKLKAVQQKHVMEQLEFAEAYRGAVPAEATFRGNRKR